MLGQQIHIVAHAVFLRCDLIAAEAVKVRTGGERFERGELGLIIRDDLLIIFLRVLGRSGGAGEHQRVDLLLRLRYGDVLEDVGLTALGAFDNIYCGCAADTQTLDHLHIGQQRRNEFEFGQMVRLLFIRPIILSDIR